MKKGLPEERRFIRIEVPLKVLIETKDGASEAVTRDISPLGIGIEAKKELNIYGPLKILLFLPSVSTPVRMAGKVAWQRKVNLEDQAPYEAGLEIMNVEEKGKNVFLKYLCDLFYETPLCTK